MSKSITSQAKVKHKSSKISSQEACLPAVAAAAAAVAAAAAAATAAGAKLASTS